MIFGIIIGVLIVAYIVTLIVAAHRPDRPVDNNPYYNREEAKRQTENNTDEWLPYKLKDSVMSNREKIMFIILSEYCTKNNLVLLSKIRIADFVEPIHTNNRRNFYHWFNRISSKHVDYLICDPENFKPKAAIELDDSTHNYQSRRNRDIFVDNVYKSVELPILHFWDVNETSVNIQLNNLFGIKPTKV